MADLVLDAEPLIKLEQRDKFTTTLIDDAKKRGQVLYVASATYAEIWCGPGGKKGAAMAWALSKATSVTTNEKLGKRAGELLKLAGLTADQAFDAIVVATAELKGPKSSLETQLTSADSGP
jgi:hypothetical protein